MARRQEELGEQPVEEVGEEDEGGGRGWASSWHALLPGRVEGGKNESRDGAGGWTSGWLPGPRCCWCCCRRWLLRSRDLKDEYWLRCRQCCSKCCRQVVRGWAAGLEARELRTGSYYY